MRSIPAVIFALAVSSIGCSATPADSDDLAIADQAIASGPCTAKRGLVFLNSQNSLTPYNVDTTGASTPLTATSLKKAAYTHMIGLGGQAGTAGEIGTMFLYDKTLGKGEIGRMAANGVYTRKAFANNLGAGWEQIVQLGKGGMTFFYKQNGHGLLARLNADTGAATILKDFGVTFSSWTSIAQGNEGPNSIIFHNKDTRAVVAGKFSNAAPYALAQFSGQWIGGGSYPVWTYDKVASDGVRTVFYSELGFYAFGKATVAEGFVKWSDQYWAEDYDNGVVTFDDFVGLENGEFALVRRSDGRVRTLAFVDPTYPWMLVPQLQVNLGGPLNIVSAAGDYCN